MNKALNKPVPFSPRVVALLLGILVVATSTFATEPSMHCMPGTAVKMSQNEVTSNWVGSFDGMAEACKGNSLTLEDSIFSWGDCKRVKFHAIADSEREIAFYVDSKANCGWAGWIVSLTRHKAESQAVQVNAYRSLGAFRAKDYRLSCSYSKRTTN